MKNSGYLLFLPLLSILGFVELYPLLTSVYISVTSYGSSTNTFLGLRNYAALAADGQFWGSLGLSLAYSSGSTLFAILMGLYFSYLLSQKFRGKRIFETIFITPLAVAPIVVGILWSPSAIWDDINTFLHFILHLPYIDVTQFYIYFPVMMISEAWEWSPVIMLVSMSVTASIPKEIFDAASIHGASSTQLFRYVSLPVILKSPVFQFIVVVRFIDAMRAFEIPFAWSSWVGLPQAGSPVDTLSLLLFKLLLVPAYGFPISFIAAASVVLLGVTMTGSLLLFRLLERLGGV